MKKIITILVFVFAFIVTTNAQQKKGRLLAVDNIMQKMTKDLELTSDQQSQIKPLVKTQFEARKEILKKRKVMRESGERPSKLERKKMQNTRIAKEKEMNDKMKSILTEVQLAKYHKLKIEQKEKRQERKKRGITN